MNKGIPEIHIFEKSFPVIKAYKYFIRRNTVPFICTCHEGINDRIDHKNHNQKQRRKQKYRSCNCRTLRPCPCQTVCVHKRFIPFLAEALRNLPSL